MHALFFALFIYLGLMSSRRDTMAGLQFKTEEAFQDWLAKQSNIQVVDETGTGGNQIDKVHKVSTLAVAVQCQKRTKRLSVLKVLYRLYLVVVIGLVALVGMILANL